MSTEAITLLRSIDASLKALLAQSRGPAAGGDVADDRDLDSQWGDPVVKFHPRDWHGEVCKGRPLSQCPPEFLDMLAATFDYFAKKAEESGEIANNGKPVAPYKRKDAARARGWAKRLRNGWKAVGAETTGAPMAGGWDGTDSEWPEDQPF